MKTVWLVLRSKFKGQFLDGSITAHLVIFGEHLAYFSKKNSISHFPSA